MKKGRTQSFILTVPKPCSQNWNELKETDGGRFCHNCQKTVVDFSGLSNKALYDYFASAKTVPCGRFHSSQLNTALTAEKASPRHWKKFARNIAALLAFLTLKNATVSAQTKEPTTIQPTPKKAASDSIAQTVIVSGTVKDGYGSGLENAEISFDNGPVAKSDRNGAFSFEATIGSSTKTSLLTVGYAGLNTVVRSYHPAMRSTSFNVVLEKPHKFTGGTMGFPVFYQTFIPQTFVIPVEITTDIRMRLAALADTFRNRPNVKILISTYGTKPMEIKSAKALSAAVKNYYVEKEGIGSDRLFTKIKPMEKGKERTFDIAPYDADAND